MFPNLSQGQTYSDEMFPSKHIKGNAKQAVKELLLSVKDSLGLKRNQAKISGFSLNLCGGIYSEAGEEGMFSEIKDLADSKSCDYIYSYTHQTNKGSHWKVSFYFNEEGTLIDYDINFILVVY